MIYQHIALDMKRPRGLDWGILSASRLQHPDNNGQKSSLDMTPWPSTTISQEAVSSQLDRLSCQPSPMLYTCRQIRHEFAHFLYGQPLQFSDVRSGHHIIPIDAAFANSVHMLLVRQSDDIYTEGSEKYVCNTTLHILEISRGLTALFPNLRTLRIVFGPRIPADILHDDAEWTEITPYSRHLPPRTKQVALAEKMISHLCSEFGRSFKIPPQLEVVQAERINGSVLTPRFTPYCETFRNVRQKHAEKKSRKRKRG